ncbi:hypothetical protein MJO29_007037 [Puccinia striiformis f. sp. tritici]|nr:hypothetical protein MJO29_007037 [Puccinia striiformis f. sp. tritici]
MASALRIPTKFRLQALSKVQSTVFQTPYNPQNLRMGDRYLTKKLKGPIFQAYYPPIRPVNFKRLNQIFVRTAKANGVTGRDLEYWKLPDLREEKRHVADLIYHHHPFLPPIIESAMLILIFLILSYPYHRLDRVAYNRKRGKGPPKKGEGRRSQLKKRR